ncbi:MAG: hypothetical protein L0Y55_19735 [Anaerolineales bacterium]|nr:hypothetical protein [Anaerolineales bacterium]
MKLWIAYVLGSFVVATFTWNLRAQTRVWILIAMTLGVLIGYYFLKQI